ncbi:hypothetical protein [Oceanobacillus sp. Castelsardo]|uniref:hypothetical protein n=1 Tax=Oceanobacillus sp. Castelsardo TaxID=1851204 RepID=UPI0008398039|nr:hypothetical protein [Oceanobacillus sp. Castelsardo]
MKAIPVSIKQCEGFWNCVTPDAWVTGVGTLIGAFLGAVLGILGAYFLFKKELFESKKEKITTFKVEYKQASRWIGITLSALKDLEEIWDKDGVLGHLYVTNEKLFSKTKEYLSEIPTNYIPSEVADDFEELIYELSGLGFYIDVYKHDIFRNDREKEETKRDLHASIEKLEMLNNKIMDFIKKQ